MTLDVELWTWRGDFDADIDIPTTRCIEWGREEQVPLTLFVSLSNKGLGLMDQSRYLDRLEDALHRWSTSEHVEFAVHTHCKNLPMSFPTPCDGIDAYDPDEIEAILRWSKRFLEGATGRTVVAHRSGDYRMPDGGIGRLAPMLSRSALWLDSSDISVSYSRATRIGDVIELPPATEPALSARHKVWAPDNMGLAEMAEFFALARPRTDVMVMNCHSFSLVSGGVDPHSRLKAVWFSLPPALQCRLRPLLGLYKGAWRAVPGLGDDAPGESSTWRILASLTQHLKEAGCEFTLATAAAGASVAAQGD